MWGLPSARRVWTTTLASMTPNASTKIAVPITLTCGGAPTRAAPQTKSGNVDLAPGVEVRDHEVVDREREARAAAPARIAGAISGIVTLPERRPLVRAEVHRRFLEMAVEADEPRLHRHDDVADAEHHVRDRDRPEAGRDLQVEEERQQRGAEHDLGRRHRQEDEQVRRAAAAEAVADERERDQCPERGRGEARDRRDLEREHHRVARDPGTAFQLSQLSNVKPCQT